jgi:tRNA(Ile)-lysidine synthase
MFLLDRIRRTLRNHDLASPGTRVVVAVSGGADSVALLYLLRELDTAAELIVAGLAHFNHQLRAEADRDEAFCSAMAAACGLPILIEREDVRARAVASQRSLEDAGSKARREFYHRASVHFAADCVAVGHTKDDQAETFLLRLLRGAGPRGLASMHPRSGVVIRPLLDCRRADLAAYLDARRIPHVEDATNRDVSIPRNRVRAELVPLLEERFNPNIVGVLADQADLARHDWLWMESELTRWNLAPGALEPGTWNLDIAALRLAPVGLRRTAVWKAMCLAARTRTVSFDHVDAVLRLVDDSSSTGPIDVPGQQVQRIGARLVLTERATDRTRRGQAQSFCYPLPVPGEARVVEAGCVVSAEVAVAAGSEVLRAVAGNRAVAVIAGGPEMAALAVRNRRPGDRFSPLGLGGRKKLQDFLVDRKVPRAARDGVPIVVDNEDRIVWVAGHEIDRAFRVTDASQAVVILTLRQV